MLLTWRNEASTRRWFLDSSRVARRSHLAWLERTLSAGDVRLYVAEVARQPVGQLRLARRRGNLAEVSFSVDRRQRGKGIGVVLLRRAAAAARRDLAVQRVEGLVKPENVASAVAFLKAGYRFTGLRTRASQSTYVFALSLR